MSWMKGRWLALRGSSAESFPLRMSPCTVNREIVLSDFALCACECEFQITYIKSFAVDKLLADKTLATPVDNLVTGFNLEAY